MVFQSFALFPHLNVSDNVSYALTIAGTPRGQAAARARELLDLVQLSAFADRRIGELSGGQRQRVAIARALAQEPDVFLLDEPMSALDAKLREDMQVELRQLQQRLGITTIVVTHDQHEAMTMADQIVVMSQGRVEQVGTPQAIYHQPQNAFVANFIDGSPVRIAIRPEKAGLAGEVNRLPAKVTFLRDVGPVRDIYLDTPVGPMIVTDSDSTQPLRIGDTVTVALPAEAIHVFPRIADQVAA
jgi:putative spermidine/putrescine transport system ATP-binding protein